MPRPLLFIGSSSEAKEVARAIQLELEDDCECVRWDQGAFALGRSNLENLVSNLDKYDFAILVFTPDDTVDVRGTVQQSPRDNVLIELGLFAGSIGRSRTFVVHPIDPKLKIPTDLSGVTLATYLPSQQGYLQAALGPPCQKIRQAVRGLGIRKRTAPPPILPPAPPEELRDFEEGAKERVEQNSDILGASEGASGLALWYDQIRPVLGLSTAYSAPCYWLDTNLNILDWNIAFDLLFSEIAPLLQYRHVNEFIARMANYEMVFQHARQFSRRVHGGEMPMCDAEPLVYRSGRYGDVTMLKVATQLHDSKGTLKGWNVSLLPQHLEWELFQCDIEQRIESDKMWSVYSVSYDRILQTFPPYLRLLEDVGAVVPQTAASVIDCGAGTGNSTASLLAKGLSVTSLEQNSAMIDRMRARRFDPTKHRVIKASAEQLPNNQAIEDRSFDAATLVNVLYSLDDPFACLTGINRVLKHQGVIGLSTTHSRVSLDRLLISIRKHVETLGFDQYEEDYLRVAEVNRRIEATIARRHTSEEYMEMVRDAGFEVTHSEDFTYEGAVMLIHARKRR